MLLENPGNILWEELQLVDVTERIVVSTTVNCCIEILYFLLPREVHELIKVSPQSLMSEAKDAQPHMPLRPSGCGCMEKGLSFQLISPFLLI